MVQEEKAEVKFRHSNSGRFNCLKMRRGQKKSESDENHEEFELLNKEADKSKSDKKQTDNELNSSSSSKKRTTKRFVSEADIFVLSSAFVHGFIKIQNLNGVVSNDDGNYYMNVKFDLNQTTNSELVKVANFMSSIWNMKSPQIILPIITGVKNFKNWKNQKLEEQFRQGIIKAANKTDMWFITSGINGGIPAMVGDAFNEERSIRYSSSSGNENSEINLDYFQAHESSSSKPLTLLGIVSLSSMINGALFDGSTTFLNLSGNRSEGQAYKFDVNPDHSHFIIYNDLTNQEASGDENGPVSYDFFRNKLELLFTRPLTHYYRTIQSKGENSEDEFELSKSKAEGRLVPMVGLVIRGDLSSIDAIDFKIKRETPVIILKGSGAAADIISFAYEEMSENKDPNYEDNFIKPEILKRLMEDFKDDLSKNELFKNSYRDKILSIVKNASKGTQKFLSIVDMKGPAFDFSDLDKYILTALLQSQTQLKSRLGKAQLERNLRLTLDWNCPALALSEIFQRDDYTQIEIKHNIFENAITRADREDFVELFLDQGFCIHRFLGRNNIRLLFTKCENSEFFATTVLQGVLGNFTNELPDDFLPEGLNAVLKELTKIDQMINILEIYLNQLGFYVTDNRDAERKALHFLIIYAVLFNRHKLAKILWKRSEDPLPMAIICSMIYKNLVPFIQENYLKAQIEKQQADFANAAFGVLDASFQNNDPCAYTVLSQKLADWNEMTVLELAYNARNRDLIAHPACQKLLTKRLFGSIQIRDVKNNSYFEFPAWIKVLLSAFLIFPMYHWIIFPTLRIKLSKKEPDDLQEDEEKDDEQKEAEETRAELRLISELNKNRKISAYQSLRNSIHLKRESSDEREGHASPHFFQKVYLVWHAPYTKFWINFICYISYLVLFGIVTLWPCCGNLILDSILWLWTATIAIEDTRIAYKNYLTNSLPITGSIIEIGIMIFFLISFFIVRIVGSWDTNLFGTDKIFASKFILCIFLLYFYYRTLFIFLPISHRLGPMLVRMKLMVKHDFTTYLRLFFIFMTAGGIAINSMLYPFQPVNWELMKRVFIFRGFMQIFAIDKADLEKTTEECRATQLSPNIVNRTYSCVDLTDGIDFKYSESKLKTFGVSPVCNYKSTTAWFILIQYYLLVKLFLPSLLTAMFSATGNRVSEKSEQLWMFQRYEIVLDYEKRLIFPPPFTLFSYMFMLVRFVFSLVAKLFQRCHKCCCYLCLKHGKKSDESTLETSKLNSSLHRVEKGSNTANQAGSNNDSNVHSYWRAMAHKYSQDAEKDAKEKAKQKLIETNMNKVREDMSSQKKSMQRLNDRVISLEKALNQNQSYLEQIKNLLSQKVSNRKGLHERKDKNYVHILSRESPYVLTNTPRFFVYEKLVAWSCAYDLYDPPFIVLNDFVNVDKIFVDDEPNLKELKEQSAQNQSSKNVSLVESPKLARKLDLASNYSQMEPRTRRNSIQSLQQSKQGSQPGVFAWNSVVTIEHPNQPGKLITLDRKSWMEDVSGQCYYRLDSSGYPKNPIGRTGVRGRGALMRYGPNKEIMAIVTRWKKSKGKPIFVERRKLLEFIAVRDPKTGLSKIPGERIIGDESRFSVVSRTFIELVFEEADVERGTNFTEEDMTSFFGSFASQTPIDSKRKESLIDLFNELGFLPTMIYRGYIDDPRNTDNAWTEAEIWNFHYDKEDYFDKRIKNPASKWREVSSDVRISSNEIIGDALKEITEIHNAFYS